MYPEFSGLTSELSTSTDSDIIEGIKNNIRSTFCLTKIAYKFKTKKFILISSDKAVRPTNIMGATKRMAELTLQAFNDKNIKIKVASPRQTLKIFGGNLTIKEFRIQSKTK